MAEKRGIDTLYTEAGEKVKFKNFRGGAAVEIDGKLLNHIEWCEITRKVGEALEDSLHKIDNPTALFGAHVKPYGIIFDNQIADSPYGGGASFIFGYQYGTDKYGAQILLKISEVPKFRRKYNGVWTEWEDMSIS